MSATPVLKLLVRTAADQFQLLNRNKSLSVADKRQLKTFFLDRMIGPRVRDVLAANRTGQTPVRAPKDRMAGQSLLTAKEVEAWLKIDVKTLYKYAAENAIPHIRLKANVRFPARELQQWIDRHFHLPPTMKDRQCARHSRTQRRPARFR